MGRTREKVRPANCVRSKTTTGKFRVVYFAAFFSADLFSTAFVSISGCF